MRGGIDRYATDHRNDNTNGCGCKPEAIPGRVLEQARHEPRQDANTVQYCRLISTCCNRGALLMRNV
jgi:hypothetical protein